MTFARGVAPDKGAGGGAGHVAPARGALARGALALAALARVTLARAALALAALAGALPGATLVPLAGPAPLSAQLPPDADWQTLHSGQLNVTFPRELEPLARRAAAVAEAARARLVAYFGEAPRHPLELVLTDHVDASNGFARVAPLPRVVVYARPPVDGSALSHFDDWIELVVVHELAHMLHLDRTSAFGGFLREIFGRVPMGWPLFPERAAPGWVIEGIATWAESASAGRSDGRLRGTAFEAILRSQALVGEFESIDRASGRSALWPAGQRPYLYGGMYFAWLLERHGTERLPEFVEAVAGQWLPWRLDAAARRVFGERLSDSWQVWRDEVTREAEAFRDRADARSVRLPVIATLTSGERRVAQPRVSRDGRWLAWARSDGRSDPQIRVQSVDPGSPADGITIRTNGLASFDWTPDGGLVFAQNEFEGPWRVRSDLYRWHPDGRVQRLTRGARLTQPSVAPDGRWAVAVRTEPGRSTLARVDLESGEVRALFEGPADPEPSGVHWGFPSVAPDGQLLAAVRWTRGAVADLVLLDAASGRLLAEVTSDRALETAPAWGAGGWLIWASDRSGTANVYGAQVGGGRESDLAEVRQFTDVVTAVGWPSTDPQGRQMYFTRQTERGWELATMPFRPERTIDPGPVDGRFEAEVGGGAGVGSPAERGFGVELESDPDLNAEPDADADAELGPEFEVRPYRPWPTLAPRYWTPIALPAPSTAGRAVGGPLLGVASSAEDLVGRHRVDLALALSTWGRLLDADMEWSLRGLGNPIVGARARQSWRAAGRVRAPDDEELLVRERRQLVEGWATLQRARWRAPARLTLSGGWQSEARQLLDGAGGAQDRYRLERPRADFATVAAALAGSTARRHELSISAEQGVSAFAQLRHLRHMGLADSLRGRLGHDRTVTEVLGQIEAFTSRALRGSSDHVFSARLSFAAAYGAGADDLRFGVGGASGEREPWTGLGLFGGPRLFLPVRGHPEQIQTGRYAWSGTLEWRLPVAWPNRGWGLRPVHLDQVHGAVFFDAGRAWGGGPILADAGSVAAPWSGGVVSGGMFRDVRTSLGLEIRAETLWAYSLPMTFRLGAAWPLNRGGEARLAPLLYLRLGGA